jgi:integrase
METSLPVTIPFRAPGSGSPEVPRFTMRELARAYLADRAADERHGSIGAGHLRRLRQHLRTLIRRRKWSSLPAADFTPRTARRWLRSHKGWKSPHQLEGAWRSLRAALVWAEEEGHIERVPTRGFRRFWPPPEPRAACRPEEFEAIMAAARNKPGTRRRPSALRFRVQVWTLWNVGCRPSELRTARWEHLDLESGLLTLPEHKTRGKTGTARKIYLDDVVLRVLAWFTRAGQPRSGPIFTAQAKRELKKASCDRLFAKVRRAAAVREEVTLYGLRHGYCVRSLQAGIGETELATLMGHASTRMIFWYARDLAKRTEHMREAAAKIHRRKPTATTTPRPKRQIDRPDQPMLW